MGTTPFLDAVPAYEVREGTVFITSGDFCLAMPLRKFKMGMAKAARAIAEYEARKAEVVPIRKRRGGHAA